MNGGPQAQSRALGPLLAGSFALAVCATVALWMGGRDQLAGYAGWFLGAAMLPLAAGGWLVARRSAAEIARLHAELVGTQARLAEFSISQGRFVGNIAHELKTPLAIVLGQTDLLLGSTRDPVAVARLARSIAEDMRHLSDLVDSFLRLARPFAQDDATHHVPVHVHDFVVEAVRRCQSLAGESWVSVVTTLADSQGGEVAPEVLGDAVLLEAMLENLVRNAVRFSPRGARVEVQVQVDGRSVLLRVRDHGAGIANEHVESVFDWFFQAPGLTLPSSDTGFGLAIARRVAEHHRGTISLRNHPDGGCEFQITLPLWHGEELPPAVGTPVAALPVARPAARAG